MSIKCKDCGKFIWSFSRTLCPICQHERDVAIARAFRPRGDFYQPPKPQITRQHSGNVSKTRETYDGGQTIVTTYDDDTPSRSVAFDTCSSTSYSHSDSSSYSCGDSGSSCGGCD